MNTSRSRIRRRAARVALSVVSTACLFSGTAHAQSPDTAGAGAGSSQPQPLPPAPAPSPVSFIGGITVSALGDVYVTGNANRPPGGENLLRNFDTRSGALRLNYVEAAFERKPDGGMPIGFRADLGAGPTATLVDSTDPGADAWRYVQQAYVSVRAPVGTGLTVEAGKFVTPAGAEVIETADNWNYSRSLLFSWAAPYYHAGVRASYGFGHGVTATGYLVNGWNNVKDNNSAKSVAAQVVVAPSERVSLAGTWMGGAEQADADGWRQLIDAVLTATLTDRLRLQMNMDVVRDRGLGPGVGWHGVSAALQASLSPKWAVVPRVEWFSDPQGASTGAAQDIVEATFTVQRALAAGLNARAEYRVDRSTAAVFPEESGGTRPHQHTVGVGLFYAWRSR